MKFAAIYARSSLGKEKQGDTVEHQIEMIKEYAKRFNIDVVFDDRFIYEDDGESGYKTTLLQRPAMRRLLSDIDAGLIGIVFFKGISRFARDSGETITTAKRLSNKGVRVISLEENYDSFRDDPTMFQIYAVMAEQESRKTAIRVSLGNKQKARNGLWAGSIPPFGYTKVKDIEDNELRKKLLSEGRHPHSLYPNENSYYVKRIFEMYVYENMGRKKIVSWLNQQGIQTPNGNVFGEKFVSDVLSNEVYIGNIVYGKTRYEYIEDEKSNKKIQKTIYLDEDEWARCENAHPPIITKELFYEAQKKLKLRSDMFNKGKRFNAAKHPLTGILKCAKCNSPMICQKRANKRKDGTRIEYRYYVCSTYHRKGRHVCDQANINADKLEELIFEKCKEMLSKYLEQINIQDEVTNKNDYVNEIKKEIDLIEVNIQKKINASKTLLETRDIYDKETFIQLNKEIQQEIKELREQKEKLEKTLKEIDQKDNLINLEKMFDEFKKFNKNDLPSKRELFHKLIQFIEIEDNKVKKIKFAFSENL